MADNSAQERSFGERFRIATLTLWLPIVALAIIPIVVVEAIDLVRVIYSGIASLSALISSSETASDALTYLGWALVGSSFVYIVRSSREKVTHHGAAFAAAVAGALANSLAGNREFVSTAPWIAICIVEFVYARRQRH